MQWLFTCGVHCNIQLTEVKRPRLLKKTRKVTKFKGY